jgi:hypothetical protein
MISYERICHIAISETAVEMNIAVRCVLSATVQELRCAKPVHGGFLRFYVRKWSDDGL